MKNLMISIIMMCVLSLMSCGGYNKIPYRQSKKVWTCPVKKKYKPKKVRHENTIFHRTNGAFNQEDSNRQ